MDVMTVFLVVPFYNQADRLRLCIDSLREQSTPFVALLVDDGSTDPAVQEVLAVVQGDARFEHVRCDINNGPAAARHAGLTRVLALSREAQDIVVLVDGDDRLIGMDALASLRNAYLTRPNCKMTFGSMRIVPPIPFERAPYADWMIRFRLARWTTWRAEHPRTFRVDLLRQCWPRLSFTYRDGRWLRGATDMALVLPLLDHCRPGEVQRLDAPLYEYHAGLSAGRVSPEQAEGERFVRGAVGTALVRAWLSAPKVVKRFLRWLTP